MHVQRMDLLHPLMAGSVTPERFSIDVCKLEGEGRRYRWTVTDKETRSRVKVGRSTTPGTGRLMAEAHVNWLCERYGR